jgi:asparagine synthase (glutamine-hydrolysing)
LKLNVLTEKYLLKRIGRKYLPDAIWQRVKRPYRAPIHRSFFPPAPLPWVQELLSERSLAHSGLFEPEAVQRLAAKVSSGALVSETEDMALVGILSAQLVAHFFTQGYRPTGKRPPVVKTVDRVALRP